MNRHTTITSTHDSRGADYSGEPLYIVVSAGQEWNRHSWSGISSDRRIKFIDSLISPFLQKFWRRRPFRCKLLCDIFWLPYIKRVSRITRNTRVLLIYDWALLTQSPYCIKKLKECYPDTVMAYIYSNIVDISGSKVYGLLDSLKNTYDRIFAFDKLDAGKYGFEHSNLIYTVKPVPVPEEYEYDLFYVGQAKDRHDRLIEIFKAAKSAGLRCRFYITGVPEEKQYPDSNIVYNSPLPYQEVLELMGKSKCLVDAIQGNSSGLTIKTCEAVMLDKKLITTNANVASEAFFKKHDILIYTGKENLREFMDAEFIPYTENDKEAFSPYLLFRRI